MWGGSLARAPAQQQAGQQGAGERENDLGLDCGAHDTPNIRIFAAMRNPGKAGTRGAARRFHACGGVVDPGVLRLNMPISHST